MVNSAFHTCNICHFRFSPNFRFDLHPHKKNKKFQDTPLPHPTKQIRLCGVDLTFFLIEIFSRIPPSLIQLSKFAYEIFFYRRGKIL